ncbi:multidrug ABC transporter substrate-binding protein [Methylomonas sp. LWB]|uniref:ABC transporter permease n=1 Tax=Methylomonas sp. LWB TaxID=1905845 RepID=UPI0008D95BA2|nr:ABC transporter permease [Methylomonas sp. LWB]OHX36375.1 multidrug ABC transporter substrate-binding protein [Methylomonas sp. LWB]
MLSAMLSEAWHAMGANRLRSALTMLGMVIGVGAVVLMMAVGEGSQYAVRQSISAMGSNLFIVSASLSTSAAGVRKTGGTKITVADAEAMKELPGIEVVAQSLHPAPVQVIRGQNNWSSSIIGAVPEYLDARSWDVVDGARFTDSDVRAGTRVALIGQTVAGKLFGNEEPIGKVVRIKQQPFVILGVLDLKGQSLDGRDQDDSIIVPLVTAQRKLFGQTGGGINMIMVKAESQEVMPAVENDMRALLRQRHRLREGMENDFSIRDLTATANTAAETARVMSMLLGSIASVSLLVGGIGIMNIMLVSVTERTREIGIRMALGAREREILTQFLLEAIIMSVIGCLIGLALGALGAELVRRFGQTTVIFSVDSAVIAFGVALTVGVFFGFYPARKAARLDPIEALRYQ